MDALPADLESRAATIDELLSEAFSPLPGEKKDAQAAAARLAAWCNASASGDWTAFARRLARDGLTLESVLPRLATVRRSPNAPIPRWLCDSVWIAAALESDPAQPPIAQAAISGDQLAFESLLTGLVDAAQRQLHAHLRPAELAHFNDEAIGQLRRALLKQLSALCAPALYDRFAAQRQRAPQEHGAASPPDRGGVAPRREFERFALQMRTTGFDALFATKPVLLRLIASVTRQWIESTHEFIVRLAADAADVRDALCNATAPSRVASVQGELSDLHNFGRSVLHIGFEDGRHVLYKPKDLRPDALWHRLVAWLNASGAPVTLRAARVFTATGHGWAEFVEHAPCRDRTGLARFYERAGAWLALFHVFAAADMHLENMIAAADQPVPIDLEMMLQGGEAGAGEGIAERRALELAKKRIDESITAIGLLPAYARSPENLVVGLGGLNGSRTEVDEACWEHADTDWMRPVRRKSILAALPNIPILDGSAARLGEFTGELRAGFEAYGRFLAENRARLIEHGFFDALAGVPVRKLLKPTRFYLFLLERLRDHRQMGDGAQWSAHLEFIARLTDWDQPQDRLWPLFRAERDALADLNVPFFTAPSDGLEVADRHGLAACDRDESGLARARRRLLGFDTAEVDWQSRIVHISTLALPGAAEDAATPRRSPEPEPHVGDATMRCAMLAGAREAAQRIAEVAIRSGPGAAWIGLDWLGDSEAAQLVPLGFDLYNGAPGIALFLAAHAQATGDDAAADLAIAGLAPLRSHLHGANAARFARGLGLGGATGLGSVVYALCAASDLLGDTALRADAHRAARLFSDELIAADRLFDVIGGSAGGILGLLKAYRCSGDDDVLARATRCGEHLLRNRPDENGRPGIWSGLGAAARPLTGISHGASGFGYALAALHQATGREEFAAAARDCLDFESRHFSAARNNWPDLRRELSTRSWPCQWCYGAGGIGLARIGMSRRGYRDATALQADVVRAATCAGQAWPASVDTLCCGDLGNIEFLDEAGIFLNDRELRDEAARRLLCMATAAQRAGDYRWGGGEKRFNLGLFRGLAGVGYTMLRRLSPNLPNVLIWE
ncbi:MAG: type 2 lanthipeptide synthetase LanM [Caldimonas sp.]